MIAKNKHDSLNNEMKYEWHTKGTLHEEMKNKHLTRGKFFTAGDIVVRAQGNMRSVFALGQRSHHSHRRHVLKGKFGAKHCMRWQL